MVSGTVSSSNSSSLANFSTAVAAALGTIDRVAVSGVQTGPASGSSGAIVLAFVVRGQLGTPGPSDGDIVGHVGFSFPWLTAISVTRQPGMHGTLHGWLSAGRAT